MKYCLSIAILILSIAATASEGGGHHAVGPHFPTILSQLINLGLLAALIYFSAGKTISGFFQTQKDDFLAQVESASKAVATAKVRKEEISQQLKTLKTNYDRDLTEAKNKAGELYRTQVHDAHAEANKIVDDSLKSIDSELQKAVEQLRVETFSKSAELAQKNLSSHLTPEQQRAWNESFSSRTGEVH